MSIDLPLIRALKCMPTTYTPIWIMRQAGRYLPEYRALRAKAGSFMSLCTNPKLAAEVTLQPLKRFPLDAAIIFSDILVIPDSMGLGLDFEEGEGPYFHQPLSSIETINALEKPDLINRCNYVFEAIDRVKGALNNEKPLIGFSGSPWTLATYMVEGRGTKTFSKIKKLLYLEPAHLHNLLVLLAETLADYLRLQVKAGADVVMIFDTWGGVLTPEDYQRFSLHYMQKIIDMFKAHADMQNVPVILFTKGGGQYAPLLANTGTDAVGLDWTVNLADIKAQVGQRVALQGNLDPAILYASKDVITEKVSALLTAYNGAPGHIMNLGHGIHPDVPPENVAHLVETVHSLSRRP